jgi:hypothetical protein
MIKLAALLTTVSHPQKQEWLLKVVESIEKLNLDFYEKIISVDKINGYDFSKQLQEDVEKLGWRLSFVDYGNRPQTLLFELEKLCRYDYILYAEDDIVLEWSPEQQQLEKLLLTKIEGKTCGILTPSLGGSTFKCEGGDVGDFDYIQRETLYEDANYLVFKRLEEFGSAWFFELGTIFVKPIIFYQCLRHSMERYSGTQIEQGLTRSWFEEGYGNFFYKATFCRPFVSKIYKQYPELVDPICKFLVQLDPYAGECRFGGSHCI